ncbi:MAG: AAA family ATPase [Acidobacteriota bacterium]|nr:AAA family ATPase [Acidobacteriota bacterium]
MTTEFFQITLPAPLSIPNKNNVISIESKRGLVFLGANGSGKTRLGSWLELQSQHKNKVHRISAQKSLMMPSVSVSMSVDEAETNLIYGYKDGRFERKISHRWGSNPNTHLLNDFENLLSYLFSEENDKSIKYRQIAKHAGSWIAPPETKLDIIKRIWEQVYPHRKLIIGGGKVETAVSENPDAFYNAAEMSDGERVVFYLIGQALSAPKEGILIIDEPELHLNKSIQSTLWDKIEAERQDCLFVYLTHDLDFAASRIDATKVCLRSFDGQTWDWYVIPQEAEIPEEVLFEIAGSRKPVIFIEGERNGLDYFVYPKLYPDFTIIPVGSCESVIHATNSFSSLKHLHRLSSYGIVDRDFRDAAEIAYLESIGISVLNFSELENLFLTEDVLHFVAEKLHKEDFLEIFRQVKALVFREMDKGKERLISSITGLKVERKLKYFDANVLGEQNLKSSLDTLINGIDVTLLYQETRTKIDKILIDENYDEAIKIYNNKGLVYQISSLFGFKSDELIDYIKRIISSKEGEPLISIMINKAPQIKP